MKKGNNSMTTGGLTLLTIAFIVLKLTKVINWSWLWVFAPVWIGAIIVVLYIVFAVVIARKK